VRISHVEIKNYRAHRNTVVGFGDPTVFIGRNGSGKSSILYALKYFYDVNAILTAEDIYAGADEEVTIRVSYSDLSDAEIDEFSPYVRDNVLVVIKRARKNQPGRYYGIVPQLPDFVDVRAQQGATNQRLAYNTILESGRFAGLPTIRNQQELVKAMDEFEQNPENASLLEPFERQEQFFGDRRAGAGRLDKFTSFVLVPAVHEATQESEKRGAIQILVDRLVTSALSSREDILQFRTEFEEKFKSIYSSENLKEISCVSDAVNELLLQYAPGAALKLEWQEAEPPPFALPAFDTRMGDGKYNTPISLQGHGMQRALVLSLLQLMASQQVVVENKKTDETIARTPDLIVAIEEPELYLHPAQCRYLCRLLSQLANESDQPRTQVIYATHSPYFVQMSDFERIRVVRRSATVPEEVPCCQIGSLTFEAVQDEIARVAGIESAQITRESFAARCASVMDVVANEGLFASVAVVVEGYGEVGCLRAVEQHLGLKWDELGIVVVPARSKNNIDRPVQIFRGLDIPCYYMFDGDKRRSGTGSEAEADTIRANRLLMRLAWVEPEDFPATQANADWGVLGDCLESELKKAFECETEWDETVTAVREELGFRSISQTLKNPDGVATVVRRLYAAGKSLPVIEDIAIQVTNLL
jgi:putative ATP-dependent endonuclease of OLD family